MPFAFQPVLKGKLLELRPLRAEDFDDLFLVAADPLIWEQHPATDRYQQEHFRTFFREALECGGTLIAIDTSDGRIHRIVTVPRLRRGQERSRDRLDVLSEVSLGRSLQWRNEATHASACIQVRRPRGLPRRPPQPPFAACR